MTWGIDVLDQVKAQLASPGDGTATVAGDEWQVQVEVETAGAVGLAARRIRVRGPQQVDLAEAGRTLAGRITYLLEPLRLLEVSEHQALVRSAPPTLGDEANEYYELWLEHDDEGTAVDVQRYRYEKETRTRTVTPLQLTWETTGRLLNDVRNTMETGV